MKGCPTREIGGSVYDDVGGDACGELLRRQRYDEPGSGLVIDL